MKDKTFLEIERVGVGSGISAEGVGSGISAEGVIIRSAYFGISEGHGGISGAIGGIDKTTGV